MRTQNTLKSQQKLKLPLSRPACQLAGVVSNSLRSLDAVRKVAHVAVLYCGAETARRMTVVFSIPPECLTSCVSCQSVASQLQVFSSIYSVINSRAPLSVSPLK